MDGIEIDILDISKETTSTGVNMMLLEGIKN
jgi:hypothetical protein